MKKPDVKKLSNDLMESFRKGLFSEEKEQAILRLTPKNQITILPDSPDTLSKKTDGVLVVID